MFDVVNDLFIPLFIGASMGAIASYLQRSPTFLNVVLGVIGAFAANYLFVNGIGGSPQTASIRAMEAIAAGVTVLTARLVVR